MKKLTTVLAVALMLSMAFPTFAAIDLGGNIVTELELSKQDGKWGVEGKTGVEVKTDFRAEGGKQVRGVVKLKSWGFDTIDKDGNPERDFTAPHPAANPNGLSIDKIWLQTDGPFWNGGPSVSTRVGDVDIKWNGLVAHLGSVRGITVEGIEAGPITARAFYAFDEVGGEQVQPMGLQANAEIQGLDLGATVMYRPGLGAEVAANASAEVVPGVSVEGEAALDAEQNYLYRVGAALETMPNVKLTAGYRHYNEFNPAYPNIGNSKPEDDAYDMATGFTVGLETEQNGIALEAEYDLATETAKAKAETTIQGTEIWAETKLEEMEVRETKFGAKRAFPVAGLSITGEYEGTLEAGQDAKHVLKANTNLNNMVPQLQGLVLNAELQLNGTELGHWAAGAEYEAPNGFSLGAGYHSENGPSVTAGLRTSF